MSLSTTNSSRFELQTSKPRPRAADSPDSYRVCVGHLLMHVSVVLGLCACAGVVPSVSESSSDTGTSHAQPGVVDARTTAGCLPYFGEQPCSDPVAPDLVGVWGRPYRSRWEVILASDGCDVQIRPPTSFSRYECADGFVIYPAQPVRMRLTDWPGPGYASRFDGRDEPQLLVLRQSTTEFRVSPRFLGEWVGVRRLRLNAVCEAATTDPVLDPQGAHGCGSGG